MELIIYNEPKPEQIKFNYEELKKELSDRLAFYNGLEYGSDEIRTAKSDRATLNKFKTAIEERRKEVKAECLKPYENFEKKIKEIVAMVDKPILAIDGQVKVFEDKVKQEKRAEIEQFYRDNIGDLKDLLPLSKIWNDRWLNATFSIKAVGEEIAGIVAKTQNDLQVISDLKSEFDFQIKDAYTRTLSLSSALQEKVRLEEAKKRQQKYEIAQIEKFKTTTEEQPVERAVVPPSKVAPVVEEVEEAVLQLDFRVWATQTQLEALRAFLKENNIRYGKAE